MLNLVNSFKLQPLTNKLQQSFSKETWSTRLYGQPDQAFDPNHSYLNGEAIVDQVIEPGRSGRVRFQGSWWYARCEADLVLVRGVVVRVVGINNITLLVEPAYV